MSRATGARTGALALALALTLAWAGASRAANLHITVPTLTCKPGDTVQVHLDLASSPAPWNIRSLEFRLKLGGAILTSARLLSDGFLYAWGAPFTAVSTDSVVAATAGPTGIAASSPRMCTVELIVSPSAPLGTDLPLTFTHLLFDEGSPSVSFLPGILHVRATRTTGVPEARAGLALAAPSPDPARDRVRLSLWLPDADGGVAAPGGDGARLELLTVDGRRVREEALGAGSGAREVTWSLAGSDGRRLAAGLYFVRLTAHGQQRVRRLILLP